MKRSELDDAEINRLVHEKVMGKSTECSGQIDAPDESDTSYYECVDCHAVFSFAHVMFGDMFKPHARGDIPHYSTDMNAA